MRKRRQTTNVIQISSSRTTSIKIAKGKPKTIKTNVPFYEIVIGDPEIANVNPLTDSSFYVLGNNLGTTGIALFDENKQLVGSVDIEVTLDTDKLASTIRDTVPGSDIDVKSANGRLVLSGSAEDAVAADKATQIATEFSGDEKVINSVNISSSQQVQLNVRFVEVNRQVGQELGTKIAAAYAGPNGDIVFNSDPQSSSNDAGRRADRIAAVRRFLDRRRHQGARGSRRRPPSCRAEPDRPLRREGELPGRRRVPDPGLGRRRRDQRHLQEVRRQPRFHADRARRTG